MVYIYTIKDSIRRSHKSPYMFGEDSYDFHKIFRHRGKDKCDYEKWGENNLDNITYKPINDVYYMFAWYKQDLNIILWGKVKQREYDVKRFLRDCEKWEEEERELEEKGLGYKSIEDFMFDTSSGNEYENVIQDELDYQVEYCFCNGYYSDNEDINYD